MKIAYVELSNVFKLINKNVVWIMTQQHNDDAVGACNNNNKLMIGS